MLFDRSGATYVGNLGPVPLFVHPSALILVLLAMLWAPGSGPMAMVLMLAVLVMAIVLHEMGHGLAARSVGAQGVTITLWAMGGLCSSYRDQERPLSEMYILAAGPAVSYALSGASYGILYYLSEYQPQTLSDGSGPNLLAQFLFMSYFVNFWLGIFNSLPIYPLDGGQFLFHLLKLFRVRWQLVHQICFYCVLIFVAAVLAWRLHEVQGQIMGTGFLWTAMLLGYLLYNAHVYLMQR